MFFESKLLKLFLKKAKASRLRKHFVFTSKQKLKQLTLNRDNLFVFDEFFVLGHDDDPRFECEYNLFAFFEHSTLENSVINAYLDRVST